MGEKTEAQKKAQKKYMEKFMVARVRMERDRYAVVQAHAEAQGESTTGFINRAIDEAMERDKAAPGAAEPVEGPSLHTLEQRVRRILYKHNMFLRKQRGGGYIVEGDGERSFNTFEELEAFAEKL